MKQKVTIYQIASEAKVSISTVSRVLTGNVKVSDDKRERILSLIEKYDYHPNSMARSLSNRRTRTIGVVLPDITHPYFNNVFYGAEAEAIKKGYTLLLGCTMNDNIKHVTNLESMFLRILREKQVDGMVVMGGSVNEKDPIEEHTEILSKLNTLMPIVTINDAMELRETYHVNINGNTGVAKLVNYLISLKHREFAYIGGELEIQPTLDRLISLKDALKTHNIDFDMNYYIPGGFDIEAGKKCMNELLQMPKLPTVVLCLNDLVAIGAMHTAKKAGLKIPDDLSIAGSDNIKMSEYLSPGITTIDQRAQDVGAKAIEVLIDAIEGKDVETKSTLEARLVIRDSCRMMNK